MSNDYEKKRSALTVSTASIDAYSDELKRIENKNDVQPMKGWMKKKSPALLKGWQKRYFMLIENLQEGPWKLVYFDNDKTDTKPNGAFDLYLINYSFNLLLIQIISKKEFTIQIPGRNLELKVKTPELCQQWITTLNSLRSATSPQRTKRQVSMDSVVKMADESPTNIKPQDCRYLYSSIGISVQREATQFITHRLVQGRYSLTEKTLQTIRRQRKSKISHNYQMIR